jgi:hypothetical protein
MIRAALFLALMMATTANATIITIDPDGFDDGKNLARVFPGVTIQFLSAYGSSGIEIRDAFAIEDIGCLTPGASCRAATGTKLFSELTGTADSGSPSIGEAASCFQNGDFCASAVSQWGGRGFNLLLVEFQHPTDFAQISGTWFNDWVMAYAFDSNFNQVAASEFGGQFDFSRCRGDTSNDWCANTVFVESAQQNISWLLAGSWAGIASVDDLKFNSVPEPGTLSLLGAALLGLAIRRKKAPRLS